METKRNSTWIALVAAIVWLVSLGLPAVIAFEPSPDSIETIRGINILLTGWLGIFYTGNLAWFANVLFIWAFVSLRRGRPTLALSWFAVLLSLTTFWMLEFPADEGGGKAWVFGYGWGALVWFSALFLLGIAAAARNLESRDESRDGDGRPRGAILGARISAVVLGLTLIAFVGGTLLVSHAQRSAVADAERPFFDKAIIKRGAVCTTPDVTIQNGIHLDGPLEVTYHVGNERWAYIRDLIYWGIPEVTEGEITYSLRQPPDWSTVILAPRSIQSGASLSVGSATRNELVDMLVTTQMQPVQVKSLRLESEGRLLIDGKWRRPHGQGYCPTFYPGGREHPPATLLQAALVQEGSQVRGQSASAAMQISKVAMAPRRTEVIDRFSSDFIELGTHCPTPSARIDIRSLGFWNMPSSEQPLIAMAKDSPGIVSLPDEFLRIGDVYFGLQPYEPRLMTSVVCNAGTMYIFSAQSGQDAWDFIDIENRSQSNPHELLWAGEMKVERPSELTSGVVNIFARSVVRDKDKWIFVFDYRRPRETNVVQVAIVADAVN